MQYYDEYKNTKLDPRMWRYLDDIARAGWKGTHKYRLNTSETWILREKQLIRRGYDNDGVRVDVVTLKGKWWLHWRRLANTSGGASAPQVDVKQRKLL